MKKICVVTGTRADFGLLRWVMKDINDDKDLELQIVATGMHLSPEFGFTYREIENDGFVINQRLEILLSSDSSLGVTKSIGLALIGFADVFSQLDPDLIILLGDRTEIYGASTAALVRGTPVAHLSGGEITEGAFDDAIRHSITKMSHLHFVGSQEYLERVIQLGEDPERVFLVGGLGVDSIKRMELMSRAQLETELDFKLGDKSLLITYHPVTLDHGAAALQISELLSALDKLKDTQLIITKPNSDTEGREISRQIDEFVSTRSNAKAFASLGQLRYFSCISHVDGVVGNSSSGLSEVPSFKKGTINIGDRQLGRLKARSVIDCLPSEQSITEAIQRLYSVEFQKSLKKVSNPYDSGGGSSEIVKIIKSVDLKNLTKKTFFDLPIPGETYSK